MKTLILGIGNILLSDEGIGIHTLDYLQTHYPQFLKQYAVQCLDGGTLSFTLAPLIETAHHLIIIDAAQLQAPVGTIRCFEGKAMDDFLNQLQRYSAHEISLIDILTMVRLTECLPKQRALIAIQPQYVEWGDSPTPEVAAAIPQAVILIRQLIERWFKL
jgi:hydrogenase maturation protease